MSFPRYPAYKDSGVEWLGEVPAHWEVAPLGRMTLEKCDGPFGSGLKSEHYVDAGVRVIRLQNIRRSGFDGTDVAFIDSQYFLDELARHEVRAGDVLIAGLGDENHPVGRACVAPPEIEPAMVKADCFRFRVDVGRAEPSFVALALTAGAAEAAGLLSSGSTRSRIPLSVMSTRRLAMPPLSEQRAVVAFLDRETRTIGALVEEQRRLIALLKEKRQAVISHAVTRGLNPDAPLKPSGVDWLGDVPAHWEVKALKHSITRIEQGWSPQCESEPAELGEWGVLKVGCGNRPKFDETEQKALPKDLEPAPEYEIRAGDILMSRGNTPTLVGMATWVGHVRPRLLLSDLLYRFRARPERADGRFLVFSLRAPPARFQVERDATGTSASMKKISQSDIRELLVPLPPLAEQRLLADWIANENERLDALTTEAERAIALLQERRTALISAAVTGQIDVRGAIT